MRVASGQARRFHTKTWHLLLADILLRSVRVGVSMLVPNNPVHSHDDVFGVRPPLQFFLLPLLLLNLFGHTLPSLPAAHFGLNTGRGFPLFLHSESLTALGWVTHRTSVIVAHGSVSGQMSRVPGC